jgi:hypothetical protein
MLADIINAVLTEERILLRLAKGELVEDKNGILRDKNGAYDALANETHHQSLAAYSINPLLFNIVEAIHFMFHPIRAAKIDYYIDSRQIKELSR